jgi:hypothetical protein
VPSCIVQGTKTRKRSGRRWLTPVILATQEVEIRRNSGSKPTWANSSRDPILKNTSPERAGGVAQGVGPEFKYQYCKKKKKVCVCSVQVHLFSEMCQPTVGSDNLRQMSEYPIPHGDIISTS